MCLFWCNFSSNAPQTPFPSPTRTQQQIIPILHPVFGVPLVTLLFLQKRQILTDRQYSNWNASIFSIALYLTYLLHIAMLGNTCININLSAFGALLCKTKPQACLSACPSCSSNLLVFLSYLLASFARQEAPKPFFVVLIVFFAAKRLAFIVPVFFPLSLLPPYARIIPFRTVFVRAVFSRHSNKSCFLVCVFPGVSPQLLD